MTGRDRARTERARRWITECSGSDRVDMALADLSRLAEVRRLADEILAGHDRLDVLVNNAGLFSPQYRLSADGFELTFAVNHLAPFLLTNLLLDRLKDSAPARIVTYRRVRNTRITGRSSGNLRISFTAADRSRRRWTDPAARLEPGARWVNPYTDQYSQHRL